MEKLVEKIRQKPHHEKNRIILISIIAVVIILIGIWIVIGIPTRNSSDGDVINDFSSSFEESKDALPDLFPENNK
jgi:uncharacterized membrane protein YvbJ